MDLVTKNRYSEVDFTIFYDLIFEINTRRLDNWRATCFTCYKSLISYKCRLRLALNKNAIQRRLARRSYLFYKFLVQVSCTSVTGISLNTNNGARRNTPGTLSSVNVTLQLPISRVNKSVSVVFAARRQYTGAAFAKATWLCVCHVDVLCPNDWVGHHSTFTDCSPANLVFS